MCVYRAYPPTQCLPSLNPETANLQEWDRNFLSNIKVKTRYSTVMQEPLHHITYPSFLLHLQLSLPLPHHLIPAWVRADRKTPPQLQDLSLGGQPCICVSKVRLPRRMLSFSGWWLWGERDDSTGPCGWCVKRHGKTRISRGPGILAEWVWPKLSVDPPGGILFSTCSYCYFSCVRKDPNRGVVHFYHRLCFLVICVPFEETN